MDIVRTDTVFMGLADSPFKVAIASGKGGTGKTLVSTSLAAYIGEFESVLLADLDVEEPNDAIFIKGDLKDIQPQFRFVPDWDITRCDMCGMCEELCNFNALAALDGMVVVYEKLCHSCYACSEMCPKEALPMKKSHIGDISYFNMGMVTLLEGRLNVNEEQPVGLIKLVQERSVKCDQEARFHIFDSPPGTSCSMIASIEECDQLLLVTEPTPFGLNDLVLALQAARLLDKPVAVVVNRYGSGNAMVEEYCKENNIDVVARIPYDMTIAERYSKGGLMLDKHCFRSVIAGIFNYLERKEANRRRR